MAAIFPFLPVASARGEAFLMPLLPLEWRRPPAEGIRVQGIIDSGATVNAELHHEGDFKAREPPCPRVAAA